MSIESVKAWVKQNPFKTYFLVFLAVGIVLQIKAGPTSSTQRFEDCVEASKIGLAARELCARISK